MEAFCSLFPERTTNENKLARTIIIEFDELEDIHMSAFEISSTIASVTRENNQHICQRRTSNLRLNFCQNEKIGICRDYLSLFMVFFAYVGKDHSIEFFLNLLPESSIKSCWLLSNGDLNRDISEYQVDDIGRKKEIKNLFYKPEWLFERSCRPLESDGEKFSMLTKGHLIMKSVEIFQCRN